MDKASPHLPFYKAGCPVEIKRVQNAFFQGMHQTYNLYLPPPEHRVYYECINVNKGIHTGWVKDSIDYGCYYP